MDSESELQRLRARIAQLEQTNERLGRTNERLEQQNQLQQETTFSQYLEYCHRYLFQSFTAQPEPSGTSVTKVDGKYYPSSLRHWRRFTEEQQHQFDIIKGALKDERVFPSYIGVREMQRRACEAPVANEDDIRPFEHIAVEGPVTDIIRALCARADTNPTVASLDVSRISFANHSLSIGLPLGVIRSNTSEGAEKQRREPSPTKRVAVEPKQINPDRRCLREDSAGNHAIAFVVEYKAAHKLQASHMRRGLDEHLFASVIKRCTSTRSSADSAQALEDRSDQILAMVLTQTFDYMIRLGLEYSYVTAGKSFLFLRVKADDPKTLYYHLVDPDEEAEDENGEVTESKTAVAQVAGFSLLALRSQTRSRGWTSKAQAALYQWPIPYPEMEYETTDEEDLSRTLSRSSDPSFHEDIIDTSPRKIVLRSRSCKDPNVCQRKDDADDPDDTSPSSRNLWSGPSSTESRTKRKDAPSPSSSSRGSSFEQTPNTRRQSRPYCTLGCLIGLKRGRELDASCPNIALHRIAPGSTAHPIDVAGLAGLMQKQLACSLDIDCEPLEMRGKYGAVGSLFKLSSTQYGYTFVGKGTIQEFVPCLAHEARVYARLAELQGEVVPVFLGSLNLTMPYDLTARHAVRFAGTKIVHMLLMSWAGEVLTKVGGLDNLAIETARSLGRVRGQGVVYNDVRELNLLWNKEQGRVIVIDFNQADLIPPPKPMELKRLLGRKRSWFCFGAPALGPADGKG
ncbi:hypothetical protein CHU98_g12333 [Xylaria longipes]|nr:hypothetical protein CHU98_g12333 [Xylaria longipes]